MVAAIVAVMPCRTYVLLRHCPYRNAPMSPLPVIEHWLDTCLVLIALDTVNQATLLSSSSDIGLPGAIEPGHKQNMVKASSHTRPSQTQAQAETEQRSGGGATRSMTPNDIAKALSSRSTREPLRWTGASCGQGYTKIDFLPFGRNSGGACWDRVPPCSVFRRCEMLRQRADPGLAVLDCADGGRSMCLVSASGKPQSLYQGCVWSRPWR